MRAIIATVVLAAVTAIQLYPAQQDAPRYKRQRRRTAHAAEVTHTKWDGKRFRVPGGDGRLGGRE